MFATHDDLATAELHVLESQRKIAAHIKIIGELRRHNQPTGIAERFLQRLEQGLKLHRLERDAISFRIRAEADTDMVSPPWALTASSPVARQYPG